jgi:hypothetical protein
MAEPQIVDPFTQVNDAATQPGVVDPFSPIYQAPKSPLLRGAAAAGRGIAATALGTGALAAKVVGANDVSAAALEASKRQDEAAGENSMRVEDVNSAGTGFDFLQYALGYLGTQLGASALGGGLGRFLGGRLGVRAAEDAAANLAAKHAGTVAGLAGTSLMQEVGQIYPDAIEQGVADPINRALVGGAIAAAADVLPETYVAKRLGLVGKAARGGGALREAAKVGSAEGATELFQTYVERASAGQPTTGPEAISDYVNSTVLGAFGGTVAGGIAGAYNKAKTAVDGPDVQPSAVSTESVQAPPAVQPAPEAAPAAPTPFAAFDATGPGNTPTTTGALEAPNPAPAPSDVIPDRIEQLSKSTEARGTLLAEDGTPLPAEPVVIGGLQVTPNTEPIIVPGKSRASASSGPPRTSSTSAARRRWSCRRAPGSRARS